jgi:dephospho-CoA kinase
MRIRYGLTGVTSEKSTCLSCRVTVPMLFSPAMILVGLTGGVATGKSTVAKMFKQCGAVVIDADQLARDAVKPDKPAWRHIIKMFGKDVLNPDRTINRHALGAIVFRRAAKRRTLERIIHPRVASEQARLTRLAARKNPRAVIIYDVPLLFEAGIDKRVDHTIVVTANLETQISRLKKRNGCTRAEAIQRIKSQIPLSKKAHRANFVLDGTSTRFSLKKQVCNLYRVLRQQA